MAKQLVINFEDNDINELNSNLYNWCLANDKAYLIDEWASDLNSCELKDYCGGTSKKVWWRCLKDLRHVWDDTISHRKDGRGCPYCSNKRILVGVNDLATTHSDLAKEWDPSNGLKPTEVTYGSTNKVKWICPKGHTYEAQISSRSNGTGCSICAGKTVLKGYNDLTTTHPEIAKDWHPTLNGDLTAADVTFGCTKKVWWKCEKGHEWFVSPNNRTNQKSGCPYCSNKKVLEGYNDLLTVNPRIASEWHPTKNGDLKPNQVTYGYNNSVWWKCHTCGYEWKTDVAHRVAGDSGCAVCAGKVMLKGYNDFATLHPELLKEWDYEKNIIDPSTIPSSYKKKVHWICSKGHKYETTVMSRAIQGTGCPYCANEKVMPGVNDLKTKNPELALEFDLEKNEIDIESLMPYSNVKVWWKCKNYGHSWEATVGDRTSGKGCPYCSNPPRKILKGFNDLFTTNPELKEQWDFDRNNKDPYSISKGSKYKAYWICNNGHSWKADVSSRACNHNGCPYCSQGTQTSIPERIIYYYLSKVFNDIEHNEKYQYMNGYELDIYIPSLNVAIEYDGERWHQDVLKDKIKDELCSKNGIKLIRIREGNLPVYKSDSYFISVKNASNTMNYMNNVVKEIIQYLNDNYILSIDLDINVKRDYNEVITDINHEKVSDSIGELFPLAVSEWHPTKNGKLSPFYFKPNSNIKVWWKCSKCNYEYEAVIESRFGTGRSSGCPSCARNRVVTGVNDIVTLYPEVVKYWDYEKNNKNPKDVAANCNDEYWWKCDKGHSYLMRVYSKTKQNHRCPYCSNQKLLVGYNDLATTHPDLCKEWHLNKNGDLKPTMVMKGTDKKVWWECSKCGYEWEAYIYSRAGKHPSGCPKCIRANRKQK